jgi:hypothetical protein
VYLDENLLRLPLWNGKNQKTVFSPDELIIFVNNNMFSNKCRRVNLENILIYPDGAI